MKMRLIDAECLCDLVEQSSILSAGFKQVFRKLVAGEPTVDAVPVVRCKDCKFWHEELAWCDNHSHFVDSKGNPCGPEDSSDWNMFDEDYFCADGDLRDIDFGEESEAEEGIDTGTMYQMTSSAIVGGYIPPD